MYSNYFWIMSNMCKCSFKSHLHINEVFMCVCMTVCGCVHVSVRAPRGQKQATGENWYSQDTGKQTQVLWSMSSYPESPLQPVILGFYKV